MSSPQVKSHIADFVCISLSLVRTSMLQPLRATLDRPPESDCPPAERKGRPEEPNGSCGRKAERERKRERERHLVCRSATNRYRFQNFTTINSLIHRWPYYHSKDCCNLPYPKTFLTHHTLNKCQLNTRHIAKIIQR